MVHLFLAPTGRLVAGNSLRGLLRAHERTGASLPDHCDRVARRVAQSPLVPAARPTIAFRPVAKDVRMERAMPHLIRMRSAMRSRGAWLGPPGRKADDDMAGSSLNTPEVGTNRGEVSFESGCMLHAILAHFLNDRIFHVSFSGNSSGEHISGHTYPSF